MSVIQIKEGGLNKAKRARLAQLLDRDGVLTDEVVVEDARPRSSPLHDHFTWDDTKAGVILRLQQARELIAAGVFEALDRVYKK